MNPEIFNPRAWNIWTPVSETRFHEWGETTLCPPIFCSEILFYLVSLYSLYSLYVFSFLKSKSSQKTLKRKVWRFGQWNSRQVTWSHICWSMFLVRLNQNHFRAKIDGLIKYIQLNVLAEELYATSFYHILKYFSFNELLF